MSNEVFVNELVVSSKSTAITPILIIVGMHVLAVLHMLTMSDQSVYVLLQY